MPSREEMIAALKASDGGSPKPSREEMIKALSGGQGSLKDQLKAYSDGSLQALKSGADMTLRAADYPGGFMRTGLANSAGLIAGKGNIVTEEDLANAAVGKAPQSAEYLERLGVPKGPEMDLNPFMAGKTSARDAAGFVGDVVTDPLGNIIKGVKGMRGLLPLSEGAESAGKSMYKSGLKNVDKIVVEKGKKPVSDILLDARKTGSVEKLSKDAVKINDDLLKARGALYQQASDAGAVVDMTAAVTGARKQLKKIRENPGMRDTADKLEEFLNKYEGEGFVDIQSVSDWKTALYDSLPQNAFGPNGRVKGPAKAFEKVLSRDFKTAIEKAADEAAPGLGGKISVVNDKMGTLITAKKPFATEVKKAVTPNHVTVMDALGPGSLGVLTGTQTGNPLTGLAAAAGALALKKGAEASRTTGFRTGGGLLLKDIGETGLIDATARQGLIPKKKKDEKRK